MMIVLMMSTLMGISAPHWAMVWISLEINTMALCYMMMKEKLKNKMKMNSVMKYFLVQTMSSAMILILTMTSHKTMSESLLLMSIMMKVGGWPTHMWYLSTLNNMSMSMNSFWLIMTWQKIMPLMLLSSMSLSLMTENLVMALMVMAAASPLSLLTKMSSPKNMMIMSSLNNNSWMLMATILSPQLLMMLMFTYTPTLWEAVKNLKKNKHKQQQNLTSYWSSAMLMGSLGGLPPMGMFWVKVMMIKKALEMSMPLEMLLFMIMMACYMMYYYLMNNLSEMTMSPMKHQMTKKSQNKNTSMKITMLASLPPMVMSMSLGLTQ